MIMVRTDRNYIMQIVRFKNEFRNNHHNKFRMLILGYCNVEIYDEIRNKALTSIFNQIVNGLEDGIDEFYYDTY